MNTLFILLWMPIAVTTSNVSEAFPDAAGKVAQAKLSSLLTADGLTSTDANNQFAIDITAVPTESEVVAGPPTQIVEKMTMTLTFVDRMNKAKMATYEQEVRGVGTTKNKAYLEAVKQLNLSSNEARTFIQAGKDKIIAYYDQEAPRILANAKDAISMRQYEKAMYLMAMIPTDCKHYAEAQKLLLEAWKAQINMEAEQNLALAKAAWTAKQNDEGAIEAAGYLSKILPDAACYPKAQEFYAQISKRVNEDRAVRLEQLRSDMKLEHEQVEAARAVGVAYGNHQQPTTTNYMR